MTTTVSETKEFKGDKKHLIHFLAPLERKFLKAILPLVPKQVSTEHLTLMTLLWSVAVIAAGYLSRGNIQWLWLFSASIVMQYITDMLDGEVGRSRNSGLIKWGFYMDHFLDYIFLSSIIIGYSFLLPVTDYLVSLFGMLLMVGFMVHSVIDFSITNNFKISCNYFGVSEARCVLIIFNTLLIIFGKGLLISAFIGVDILAFLGLCSLVFNSQKIYRHLDVLNQAQKDEVSEFERGVL